MNRSSFESLYGFRRDQVSLANWRTAPWNVWAFRNVSEFVPTAVISAGSPPAELPDVDPSPLLRESLVIAGERKTVGEVLEQTSTDALVVMKSGHVIADYRASSFTPGSRHIVFSISKSLTAILSGITWDAGLLDPDAPITTYVPEIAGSAYGDAKVRHILDMRMSLALEENYLDTTGGFARYRRATLWNPPEAGQPGESLLDFIATLPKGAGDHGGPFRYRSPNSDLLGIVVERATGQRYADFASTRLWQPIGARQDGYVTVDAVGASRAAGGVVVAARDLARVGEMMRQGGTIDGRRVVSQAWVEDTTRRGDAEAWRRGDFSTLLANGSYRNKWYQTGFPSGAFFGFGIHGQWVYVNPKAEMVAVKMSSQPIPMDGALDLLCLELLEGLAAVI